MDILAHGLWTNAAFYKKFAQDRKSRYLAALFGVLPDIVSFAPSTIYLFFIRQNFSPTLFNSHLWIFDWARESYQFTHSLVIFLTALIIVAILRKGKLYWPIFGWSVHILIDIPTHRGFYETPFLHPLSDYRFSHGLSWAEPTFMFINYGSLITVYLVWFIWLRKRKLFSPPPREEG